MFAMKTPPDVIALDIGMPGGSGFDVLKRLKQSVRTERIRWGVSNSIVPDVEAAVRLGAAAFLRSLSTPRGCTRRSRGLYPPDTVDLVAV